jgi:hypothetical protein
VTWWVWVFLWAALTAGAAWTMFLLGRSLWRKSMALLGELGTASERFAVLSEEVNALGESSRLAPELAVFEDPADLRRQRAAGNRHRARHRAQARPENQVHQVG